MAQKSSHTKGGLIGGIIGVAAAATAGAYFLYGTKKGKHARKHIKGWTLKAKGEVLQKMELLKDVNEEAYHKVVDAVLKRYSSLKDIDSREIMQISRELKDHWRNIQRELEHGARKVSRVKNSFSSAQRKRSAPQPKKARTVKAKKSTPKKDNES